MSKNVKTNGKKRLAGWVIFAVLLALAAVGGYWFAARSGYKIDDVRRNVRRISSGAQLMSVLKRGDVNDDIYLMKDITVTAPLKKSLGTAERPFVGTLHGNGYTVVFEEGAAGTRPLFGYIGEEGRVEGLTVENMSCTVPMDGAGAGIALSNAGTISDCHVLGAVFTATGGNVRIGGLAAWNSGTITRCVAEISVQKKVATPGLPKNDRPSVIGGIAGWNEGSLSSVIADASYTGFDETDMQKIESGQAVSYAIGVLSGRNAGELSLCAAVYAVGSLNASVFSDAHDSAILFFTGRGEIFTYATVYEKLGFDRIDTDANLEWKCTDEGGNFGIRLTRQEAGV